MNDNLIKPRKQMAMGDKPSGEALSGGPFREPVTHPDAGMDTSKRLGDGERGHTPPSGQGEMRKPGVANHGPMRGME